MNATSKTKFYCLFLLLVFSWRGAMAQETRPASKALPVMVDLRPEFGKWRLSIKRQGARNTCGVFAVSGALEFALAKKLDRGVRLSEEYLNWSANVASGDGQDGATYSELVDGFNRWGICRETIMPYAPNYNAFNGPGAAAMDDAQNIWKMGFQRHWIMRGRRVTITDLIEVKKILSSGYPVCGESEHCLLLVGYQDDPRSPGGGTFLTRNSATVRYETMSYAEAAQKFYSLLWIDLPKTKNVDSEKGG